MGKRALSSHMEGAKHKKVMETKINSSTFKNFFQSKKGDEVATTSTSSSSHQDSVSDSLDKPLPCSISSYLKNEDVIKAEILWSVNSVVQHRSLNSSAKDVSLFPFIFTDSEIAKKMQLQRTKMGYVIVFGIAPYFKKQLMEDSKKSDFFTIGFDESLNKVAQKGQMDLTIRFYWDKKNQVRTRFLSSAFLGHSTAADILREFLNEVQDLNLTKLLQISMDGPNVNVKFIRDLKDYLKETFSGPVLLNVGSCSLHSVNNAFKAGMKATKWNVVEFLRALYNLLKNVPARRADYSHLTGSSIFPLKFSYIRWVENSRVAERAIIMLPYLKVYVKGVEYKTNNITVPNCDSYVIVKNAILGDSLLLSKLVFFQTAAKEFEPFLTFFQHDRPLLPFMYRKLEYLLKNIFCKFLKRSFLDSVSVSQISTKHLDDKNNIRLAKNIDLGFAVRDSIRSCRDKLSDKDLLIFRQECLTSFIATCKKLLERSPLQYKLTKAVSFLDPRIACDHEIFKQRFIMCLEIFVQHGWFSGIEADEIDRQLKNISGRPSFGESLKVFSQKDENCRLDTFWLDLILKQESHNSALLIKFLKMIFCLSHGNAFLERGFSINRECIVENLSEKSLIAQRIIYDAIANCEGGLEKLNIDSEFIRFVKNSRSQYESALKSQRINISNETEKLKKRKLIQLELKELEETKKKMLESVSIESSAIDDKIDHLKKSLQ